MVVTPIPLISGSVIECRTIAMLQMTDEAGPDAKLLAVPVDRLCKSYRHVQGPEDMPETLLNQIAHFFEHYKDLEEGKWVKVEGWLGPDAASFPTATTTATCSAPLSVTPWPVAPRPCSIAATWWRRPPCASCNPSACRCT